jgi:hypothetical protein
MSDLATRTLAPLVANTSKRLGVDLPQPVLDAMATANTLRTARRSLFNDVPDLTTAVASAVLANKDPLASKDVQRALLAQQLDAVNIESRLSNRADDFAAAAVLENAPAIIDSWRPIVENADEALREFRTLAPGADLFDIALGARLPARTLTPWGRARESAALLEILAKGWRQLAKATSVHMPDGAQPLIFADLSLEQLAQLDRNAKADDVVRLDVSLQLADFGTYAERVARLLQDRRDAQAYEDNAPARAREERRKLMAIRIPAGTP